MNKKGLSTVVTTLILILLVLVAIGIVWVVIANVIKEGVDEVSLGRFTISLNIKSVSVNSDSIDVKVKRNSGAGELTGIKFLVSDGVNVEEFEEATEMGELGQKTFTLNYDGLVKEISIAPILKSESGKELFGSVIDMKEFSNEEIIENLGGVSWWRFEGNANDKIGGNDGNDLRNIETEDWVNGKSGNALNLDGVDECVVIPDSPSLRIANDITIVAWVKYKGNQGTIIAKHYTNNYRAYYLGVNSVDAVTFQLNIQSETQVYEISSNTVLTNDWHQVVATYDQGTGEARMYLDGIVDNSTSFGNIDIMPTQVPVTIGCYLFSTDGSLLRGFFNGTIDEPMIFDRALSEDEVKALYELDLS